MLVLLKIIFMSYLTFEALSITEPSDNNNDNNNNNHNYIKILESDWSSAGLISAVIGQLHTSCACNWTVVRVMPE